MATTVMTFECGTIHQSLFVQLFQQIQKLTECYVNYDIFV